MPNKDSDRLTRVRMCYIWLMECNQNKPATTDELNDGVASMFKVISFDRAKSISTRTSDHSDGKGDNLFKKHYKKPERYKINVANPSIHPDWYQRWLDGDEFWYDGGKESDGTHRNGRVSRFSLPSRPQAKPYVCNNPETKAEIDKVENEGDVPVIGNSLWIYQGNYMSHEDLAKHAGFVYELTCVTPGYDEGRDFRYAGGKRTKPHPPFKTYRGSGSRWLNFLRAGFESTKGPLEITREIKILVPKIDGETDSDEIERVQAAETTYLKSIDAQGNPEYANQTNAAIGYGKTSKTSSGTSSKVKKPDVVFIGKEVEQIDPNGFALQRLQGGGLTLLYGLTGLLNEEALKNVDSLDPKVATAISEFEAVKDLLIDCLANVRDASNK